MTTNSKGKRIPKMSNDIEIATMPDEVAAQVSELTAIVETVA